MPNLFSSYRFLNATKIVKLNIRPNNIKEDINGLLNALIPLKYLSNIPEGSSLERQIVAKLNAKSGILDLLIYFGYVQNNRGEYIYQSSRTVHERERRENGLNEFQKFFTQLKSAQNGTLEGFEDFIRNSNRYSDSSDDSEFEEEPLPNQGEIRDGNTKTFALIQSLKKSLVSEYNAPSHNFMRRKIALLSFKQNYPQSHLVNDDLIDQAIDQKVRSLKQKDTQTNVPRTDNVYIECLIRANFNEIEALEILNHNRPNLELPIEQTIPKISTKISIDNSIEPLKQHYRLLNQSNNGKKFVRQFSREGDKWENTNHIVQAVHQLRQKINITNADEIFSKMYRLLYSELLPIIGRQSVVKIEMFALILCESPSESLENLDIVTIKSILCSTDASQISDNFQTHVMNSLSKACPICLNSFPRNKMESMFLCDHMCCLDCAKDYYRTNIDKIQDSQSLNILTCFMEPHELTNETNLNFFVYLEAKFNQWFHDDPNVLEKYHDKLFYAARGKQIKKCGSSKCISSFYVDDNNEIARVRCPHCQFAQCGQCCLKWHPNHSEMQCNEYKEWLIDNDPDDPDVQALNYLSANGIVCPNEKCKAIYEYKAGGCEHFTCEKCKTDFCRMCSVLFYLPTKNQKCPVNNCILKSTIHAHCPPNCFRETRIGEINAITKLLNDNHINVTQELQKKSVSTNKKCPVEDCGKPTTDTSGNRLCETCYKQFLCSIIWSRQLQPWEIYEDNNLQQMLTKASVPIPANVTRKKLIELCQQHLNPFLGKPKTLKKSAL